MEQERGRKRKRAKIQGRRLVAGPAGDLAVTLVRPGKETAGRWGAAAGGKQAHGDTIEEAVDNLRDALFGREVATNERPRFRR